MWTRLRVCVKVCSMRKKNSLKDQISEMARGDIIEVKSPMARAAAHRFAQLFGFSITTRSKLVGKGYEIVRN